MIRIAATAASAPYRSRLPPAPPPTPPLLRFVVLSILLHVLVVLVFGNPQRGGGTLGAWRDAPFAVTLRVLLTGRESPWKPSLGADQGSAGSPLARPAKPAARSTGAAAPARPERPRAEAPLRAPEAPPSSPPRRAEPAAEVPAREEPPVPGTLPRIDRGAPEVVDKAVVPNADIRSPEPPTEAIPRADLEAPAVPETPPLTAPAQPEPAAPALPPSEVAPPGKEEAPTPKPEARSEALPEALPQIERELPKIPEFVAPATLPIETQPSRIEQETPPNVEREKPPFVEPPAKRKVPAATTPRTEPEAAPKIEQPVVPPASAVSPPEPPAAAVPSSESAPAPAIERAITPAAPTSPRAVPAEAPALPATRQKIEAESPQPPAPREAPAAAPVPRLSYGVSRDVDDIFAPRQPGDPSTVAAPAPIDLDAAREIARRSGRITYGRTGIIPLKLFPPPPEPESKLGRAIQKAAQPDCRDAYASMGLLAIPFLLKDAVTDSGCRW